MPWIRPIHGVALALVVGLLLGTQRVWAGNATIAEALFVQGKKLMTQRRYAEACPKLAESQRLDPGGGVLLSLALCHEAEGKIASAWSEFREAEAIAKSASRTDRERIAHNHASALDSKLSFVTIHVVGATAELSGVEVKRDDAVLGSAAWGVSIPIDPGEHTLAATAPGKKGWSTSFSVTRGQAPVTLEIPLLADAPAPVPEARAATEQPKESGPRRGPVASRRENGSTLRTTGFVIGGVGVAALAVGGITSALILSKQSKVDQHCDAAKQCDALGIDAASGGDALLLVNALGWGIGAAAVGVVVVLVLAAPSSAAPTAQIAPARVGSGTGLALGGHF